MGRIIRVLCLVIVLSLVCVSFAGAEHKEKYVIALSHIKGTVPFQNALALGVRTAIEDCEKKYGVEIDFIQQDAGAKDMSATQYRDLEDLAAQGIDGLVVYPADTAIIGEAVKSIYNADGIPVVTLDSPLSTGEVVSWIASDNYGGGAMAAEYIASILPAGAKVAVCNGAPGRENAVLRANGFVDKATELGLSVLPVVACKDTSMEVGRTTMEDLTTSDPDLACVFYLTAAMGIGAVAALENATDTECEVAVFDIDAVSYEMIADGRIAVSIIQDPYMMGYSGVEQLMFKIMGEDEATSSQIYAPTKLCTAENVSDFASDPQVSLILEAAKQG